MPVSADARALAYEGRSTPPGASVSLLPMRLFTSHYTLTWPALAWSTTALTGVVLPVLIMLALSAAPSPLALAGGPVFTLGLMGVGIIAAATAGHFWIGVLLALLNVACLMVLAFALGMPALPHPVSTAFAMVIASGSFAARGALFAKTLAHRGWLMALFVVAGEASVLLIASVFRARCRDGFWRSCLPSGPASRSRQRSPGPAPTRRCQF
jgi:hypothetical protein